MKTQFGPIQAQYVDVRGTCDYNVVRGVPCFPRSCTCQLQGCFPHLDAKRNYGYER